MGKLVIGSLVAAVVMFLLGFVFYGLLMHLGWSTAPEATQLAVQEALKALPGSGVYTIPAEGSDALAAATAAGPVAQISYHAGGVKMVDPVIFAGGYVHMAVSVFLVGLLLWNLRDRVATFAERAQVVVAIAAIFSVYIHLAAPIWYHGDWRNALYLCLADTVIYVAGGLIVAKWFLPRRG